MLVRAAHDQLAHLVEVERRYAFRERHVHGDGSRHAHLVDLQIWVARNDRSGAEIDALAHQVASDSSFLSSKARADRSQRFFAFRLRFREPRNPVVLQREQMILQQLRQLRHNVRTRAHGLLPLQRRVTLHNVLQLQREVVFGPVRAERDRRPHRRRRHRHVGENEPGRLAPPRREAHGHHVLPIYAGEDIVGRLRG